MAKESIEVTVKVRLDYDTGKQRKDLLRDVRDALSGLKGKRNEGLDGGWETTSARVRKGEK